MLDTGEDLLELEVWEEDGIEDDIEDDCRMFDYSCRPTDSSFAIIVWTCHFVKLLQKKHYLSDTAIQLLIAFLAILFNVLSRFAPQISKMAGYFPSTIYKLNQLVGEPNDFFVRDVEDAMLYTNTEIA